MNEKIDAVCVRVSVALPCYLCGSMPVFHRDNRQMINQVKCPRGHQTLCWQVSDNNHIIDGWNEMQEKRGAASDE